MEESWHLLRSAPGAAAWNMAVDEALLLHARRPTLRLYSWNEPAATFGYFQRYDEVAAATKLRPLIRRCTGGGIVPHDQDWTYSLVFPADTDWFGLRAEESYRRVHEWVAASFTRLEFATELADCCEETSTGECFTGFEKHDVLLRGSKLAGAAQRRVRSGLLFQGSIQPPSQLTREPWEHEFLAEAERRFKVLWREAGGWEAIREKAGVLEREKYATDDHNRRR